MIDQHTIRVLEYPKVLSLIKSACRTPYGMNEVDHISPLFDRNEIIQSGKEITEMKGIINFGLAFPLSHLENCRDTLKKSEVEGVHLDPMEILQVLELIEVSINLYEYDRGNREKFPLINDYLTRIRAFPELRKEIRRSIDSDGFVLDSASSKLKQIRLELNDSKRKIVSKLNNLQAKQTSRQGFQDDVVTTRNGRYVMTVASSNYRSSMGILHDRSQTGATFYIEPTETVELNNRLNMLTQEEHVEIDRILRAITTEIRNRLEPFYENTRIIGRLDKIYACATFSNKIKGNQPIIDTGCLLTLNNVKHPLLIHQLGNSESVIPNSISLNQNRQGILITGPNTGGKTITLKTAGLSLLMAQSGLHISADADSEVGIFEHLYADIGDEQSIEFSLSTFSSHMANIVRSLKHADERTLLLYDEIGVGTDPREGAALAEAVVLYGIKKGALLLATTHYSQLKILASEHPEIENASLEFNRKTLAPTYRLQLGIPGSSYAVEIAGQLGLPEEVCNRAADLVGSSEKSLTSLISSLEAELATVRKDRADLSKRLEATKELEEYYQRESKKLEKEIKAQKKEALSEMQDFLLETRREIEHLVLEIRKSQADSEVVKQFHNTIKQKQKHIEQLQDKPEPTFEQSTVFEVGNSVEILSLQQQGEIEELLGKEKARVRIGSMVTTAELRNLRKLAKSESSQRTTQLRTPKLSAETVESPEIHLRGMTVDEAMDALEKFIDRALISGLTQIYVVHGKGTGTLRRTLTSYLQNHSEVNSLRLGDWNEGGAGVTIVKLKE